KPTGPTITGTCSCPVSLRARSMRIASSDLSIPNGAALRPEQGTSRPLREMHCPTGGSQSGSCTPPLRQCRHGSQNVIVDPELPRRVHAQRFGLLQKTAKRCQRRGKSLGGDTNL